MKIPADLLARPAQESVRRLALGQLERATAARQQLVEGDREEALHDFRVALRRLRSLLRSHRSAFAIAFPKKALRRLAALARHTNPGRDAEVQLAWLLSFAAELRPTERPGHRALTRELAERRDECYRQVEREIVRDFAGIAESLGARLVTYRVTVDLEHPEQPQSFAAATREALAGGASEFLDKLAQIQTVADESSGHAARIAAKRLRYLIEPVAPWIAAASPPIELLKSLQDLLGELHDGQLLAAQVAQALGEIEAKRAQRLIADTLDGPHLLDGSGKAPQVAPPLRRRERAGLIAIAKRLGARRSELFRSLAETWLGESAAKRQELVAALAELDLSLAAPPRRPATRPRRATREARTPKAASHKR
ncbi:MAG: CHAD domain-containing protein [Thermoanaerobaculia bacterium]